MDDFLFDWKLKRNQIFDLTNQFLKDYRQLKKTKLSSEPEWKIDGILKDITGKENFETENLNLNQKIEIIIESDFNPFINYAKELVGEQNTNDNMNSLISKMTNAKFLDSINIYSNQSLFSELISHYVNEIDKIKI